MPERRTNACLDEMSHSLIGGQRDNIYGSAMIVLFSKVLNQENQLVGLVFSLHPGSEGIAELHPHLLQLKSARVAFPEKIQFTCDRCNGNM